ncbi:hypothetical protein GGF37_002630 [Kickxella alabastrina]|nr:hypothetical protein GGF37_002630 [Kickxella alabastrina]
MSGIVRNRASGVVSAAAMQRAVSTKVLRSVALAETKRVSRAHTAPVHCMAIDKVEHRFLLSAGADTSIQLFDLEATQKTDTCASQIEPAHHIPAESGHTRLISSIEWYAADTGMFSTASFDHTVRIWDAVELTEACQFDLGSRVNSHRMSATGSHSLIAAADESPYIRLCDLATGAFAQTVSAHAQGCAALAWSPTDPYTLATGGNDGCLKLWDIRRADSQLYSLDAGNSLSTNPSKRAAISSVLFTEDGCRVVSARSDHRVQVWSVTNFPIEPLVDCHISIETGIGSSAFLSPGPIGASMTSAVDGTTAGSEVMFIPNGNTTVAMVDISSGQQVALLDGHFAPTTCTAWRVGHLELYTSGADSEIIVWCPPANEALSDAQMEARADAWSDDDSDGPNN